MMESESKQRILITGGSGFVGTNLVEFYRLMPGCTVLSLDVAQPKNTAHKEIFKQIDILDFNALNAEIQKFSPTIVFHLAARTDLNGRTLKDYSVNTTGVLNIINSIKGLEVKPSITLFASSRLVCAIGYRPQNELDYCPTTAYGESKVTGEQLVRAEIGNSFFWHIFRPTSLWGPWFGVPYRGFFDAIKRNNYLHPANKKILKSFGFVGNAVFQLHQLAMNAVQVPKISLTYLCDIEPLNVLVWAQIIADEMHVSRPRQVPLWTLNTLATLGSTFENLGGRNAPLTKFRLANLMTDMTYDLTIEEKILGRGPFSLVEGVRLTCEWMADN